MRAFTLGVASVLAFTLSARASADAPSGTGGYAEALAGPAFATYFPIDPGAPNEHFTTGGTQLTAGIGHGWRFGAIRFDLGFRLQYQTLTVSGRYDADTTNDAFRAHYTFVAPLVHAGLTTQLASRVNAAFGISLGTATFFSERQGARVGVEQIPFYGNLELGMAFTLTDWIDATALVVWQPPLGGPNVIAPELGARVRF